MDNRPPHLWLTLITAPVWLPGLVVGAVVALFMIGFREGFRLFRD